MINSTQKRIRCPFSDGRFPLGLLCSRQPFPDFDDMVAMLLLVNQKSSLFDEIVTDAMVACLLEIQGQSIGRFEKKESRDASDPMTLVMIDRIKMLMAANPHAGISKPPRLWSEELSGDQSLYDIAMYRLDRPSLLHILFQSHAYYLNPDVRLTLTRIFLERDTRVLQWPGLLESLVPLQAAILYGDAKVVGKTLP